MRTKIACHSLQNPAESGVFFSVCQRLKKSSGVRRSPHKKSAKTAADYGGSWQTIADSGGLLKIARKSFFKSARKNIFQLFFLVEKSWRIQADHNFGGYRRTLADICELQKYKIFYICPNPPWSAMIRHSPPSFWSVSNADCCVR